MPVIGGFADEDEKVEHYVPGAHKALTLGGGPGLWEGLMRQQTLEISF